MPRSGTRGGANAEAHLRENPIRVLAVGERNSKLARQVQRSLYSRCEMLNGLVFVCSDRPRVERED